MTKSTQKPEGLTTEEANKRQEQFGKNELTAQKKENFLRISKNCDSLIEK